MVYLRRKIILILLLLTLAVSAGCTVRGARPAAPEAAGGLLDLSDWDFPEQGNVSLDGDWAFYWDALLSPGTFGGIEPTGYFRLPSGWAKYKTLDLPVHGVATYRLEVKTAAAGFGGGAYIGIIDLLMSFVSMWAIDGFMAKAPHRASALSRCRRRPAGTRRAGRSDDRPQRRQPGSQHERRHSPRGLYEAPDHELQLL